MENTFAVVIWVYKIKLRSYVRAKVDLLLKILPLGYL